MREIYNKTYTIKKLLKLFDRRIRAVSEIQREFVWNAKKACALVDSILFSLYDTDDSPKQEQSPRGRFLLLLMRKNHIGNFEKRAQDFI